MSRVCVAFCVLVVIFALFAGAKGDAWSLLSTSGDTPRPGVSAAAAASVYGLDGGSITYEFGGHVEVFNQDSTVQISMLNEMHALFEDNATWIEVAGAVGGLWPSARAYASLIFNAEDQTLLLFGGVFLTNNYASQAYNREVWEYSLANGSWAQLPEAPVAVKPKGRSGSACVYDAVSRRLVVFGGAGPFGFMNDVWHYQIDSGVWTMVQAVQPLPPTGLPVVPGVRHVSSSGLDTGRRVMVLNGGETASFVPGRGLVFGEWADTWELSIDTFQWVRTQNENDYGSNNLLPPVTYTAHAMLDSNLVAYGGDAPGGSVGCGAPFHAFAQNVMHNTWIYDNQEWFLADAHGHPPPAKRPSRFTMANGQKLCFRGGFNFICPGPGQVFPPAGDVWCINMRALQANL